MIADFAPRARHRLRVRSHPRSHTIPRHFPHAAVSPAVAVLILVLAHFPGHADAACEATHQATCAASNQLACGNNAKCTWANNACTANALASCANVSDASGCLSGNDCTYKCEISDYINNVAPCENDCATCRGDAGPDQYASCQHCYCSLTEEKPKPSKVALNLCHQHTASSCCLPVFDMEIEEHYSILVEAGDRCLQELVKPKLFLRDLFCMACSPYQPDYLVNGVLRICKSLADEIEPSKFDECGMMQVGERGMEVYGDDTVKPSLTWASTLAFISDATGAKPPFLEDFQIQIIDDNTNCFGASAAGSAQPTAMLAIIVALVAASQLRLSL